MLKLVEMSANIVLQNQSSPSTPQALLEEIRKVYAELKAMAIDPLEEGEKMLEVGTQGLIKVTNSTPIQPAKRSYHRKAVDNFINMQQLINEKGAIGANEITCLECGHGGMKVLKQHLTREHHMSPNQYKAKFGIPSSTPLVCTSYHESRKQNAIARGLGKHKHVRRTTDTPMVIGASTKSPTNPVRKGTYGSNSSTGNGSFSNNPKVIIRKKASNS